MKFSAVSSKKVKNLVKGRPLYALPSDATAAEASQMMRARNIGAIAVIDDGKLVGIVSERDIVQRCVGVEGCDPKLCPVSRIMSAPVVTIDLNMSMSVAVVLMLERNIRHLPVMKGDKILGMISIRQLVEEFRAGLESSIVRLVA
jgi:CBS domain-containing protein